MEQVWRVSYEWAHGIFSGDHQPACGHFVTVQHVTLPLFKRGRYTVKWRGRRFCLRVSRLAT